jgi:hypothetical protein
MDNEQVIGDVTVESIAPEKTFSQEDLNRTVQREKLEVEARVRRELEAAHKAELAKLKSGEVQSMGGMSTGAVDTDAIYKEISDKLQADMQAKESQLAREQHEKHMQSVADKYFDGINRGKTKYNDFEEILGDFDHAQFPQLVHAVSELENPEDVMYELANNPTKLEKINWWLVHTPQRGMKELQGLSDSIKQTNQAVDEYTPTNAPLSQIKQSNVSTNADTGLEALKRDPALMF